VTGNTAGLSGSEELNQTLAPRVFRAEEDQAGPLPSKLGQRLKGRRSLLVGVGNELCGDDGVGSLLAQRLGGRLRIPSLDVADVPENYIGPIESFGAEVVLVVDAVDFGGRPGDLALLELPELVDQHLFSHKAGLGLTFQAMEASNRPEVLVLGIQPASIVPGRALSPEVQASLEGLEYLFLDLFGRPDGVRAAS
jgi:hydrogenase 3 maturation protease